MATRSTNKSRRGGRLKKPPPAPSMLPIRINRELIERIDEVRPELIPREPFVRYLIDNALKELEEEG